MKTKVFAHKGIIGIEADIEEGKFIVNPYEQPGNLGFVCDATEVEVSAEAIVALKKLPRGNDDLGEVDTFKTDDGRVIFSWLGHNLRIITPDAEIARNTNFDLLVATEGVEPDPSFVEYVEKKFPESDLEG